VDRPPGVSVVKLFFLCQRSYNKGVPRKIVAPSLIFEGEAGGKMSGASGTNSTQVESGKIS